MIEIKFDLTSVEDRDAVLALLASYGEHTAEKLQLAASYVGFIKRRGRNGSVKTYVIDFLNQASTYDDVDVEVQDASGRIVVRLNRSNVVIIHTSGRALFRMPDVPWPADPGKLLGQPPFSEQRNGWITQLYLGSHESVKLALELLNTIVRNPT